MNKLLFRARDEQEVGEVKAELDSIIDAAAQFWRKARYSIAMGIAPKPRGPIIAGAARDNDRNYFRHAPGSISADTVGYFGSGSRPYMAKRSHLILVTAGSDEDETVDSDWAYNSDAAPTTWTNVIVAGATIDVGGSTLTAAALVLQDADAGSDLDVRVPAGITTRNNLDVAGTTPSFTVIAILEYITL